MGDLETSAHLCHHICAKTPCCVIDIEYRKIPEYPFPIGIMDSLSVVAHILLNHKTFSIDPQNVVLGGESSGATIALILDHMIRDAGANFVKGVVVGTPTISDVRKYATPIESPWPSMRESEHAPLLNWRKMKWFDTFKWMSLSSQHPAPTVVSLSSAIVNDTTTPRNRPSHKEQQADLSWFTNAMNAPCFEGLAPVTWIGTAEFDPLRDEAEAYAMKCQAAGNNVVLHRFPGVPHQFMHMDGVLQQGKEYVEEVIKHVRMALYPARSDEEKESDEAASSSNDSEQSMEE